MKKDELLIKYIETTSKCNYSCPICVERTRNCNLPMDEFYKIVDTNRDLFYTFIHDFIENNLRSISGKFMCVRSYEDLEHDIYIPKGSEVTFDKGYANVISNGNLITYKMPIEEIFSHFKFISK